MVDDAPTLVVVLDDDDGSLRALCIIAAAADADFVVPPLPTSTVVVVDAMYFAAVASTRLSRFLVLKLVVDEVLDLDRDRDTGVPAGPYPSSVGLTPVINSWCAASLGVIRAAGSQVKHRAIKSKKTASVVPTAFPSGLVPGNRVRPFLSFKKRGSQFLPKKEARLLEACTTDVGGAPNTSIW